MDLIKSQTPAELLELVEKEPNLLENIFERAIELNATELALQLIQDYQYEPKFADILEAAIRHNEDLLHHLALFHRNLDLRDATAVFFESVSLETFKLLNMLFYLKFEAETILTIIRLERIDLFLYLEKEALYSKEWLSNKALPAAIDVIYRGARELLVQGDELELLSEAQHGYNKRLELLLKSNKPSQRHLNHALVTAAANGYLEAVKILLSWGAMEILAAIQAADDQRYPRTARYLRELNYRFSRKKKLLSPRHT